MSCIIGYKGKNDCFQFLLNGINRIKDRGYDSIGIAVLDLNNKPYRVNYDNAKKLVKCIEDTNVLSNIGYVYTCWDIYHPIDKTNKLQLVDPHEIYTFDLYGKIANLKTIVQFLASKHIVLNDINDHYCLDKLIIYFHVEKKYPIEKAICKAVSMTEGNLCSMFMPTDGQQTLFVVNRGGIVTIGVEYGNYYIASDIELVKDYTDTIMHLNNEVIATINETFEIKNFKEVLDGP